MAEEGKNINLIQKLIFINNEQEDDCIKLTLNIYRHLKEWYKFLKIRATNGKCEFKNKLIFNIKSGI